MNLTKNEEDYLKALFQITLEGQRTKVGTNQLADYMGLAPASVSSMLKKLREKELVTHKKYGKLELTESGRVIAIQLMRKHRLWETFLYKCLNFTWDEVHEVAEQLEHIRSSKLINELDRFLGYPKRDPHGDVIPDADGYFLMGKKQILADLKEGEKGRLVSVKDRSAAFLKYVSQLGLALNSLIEVAVIRKFDGSMTIVFDETTENVSQKFAEHIFVEKI